MFVGHEAVAFALAAWLARAAGADRAAAVSLGLVAGGVALLPDLDLSYGVVRALVATAAGDPPTWDRFWGVSNALHRGITHPLPVGAAATAVFAGGVALGRRPEEVAAVDADAAGAASRLARRARLAAVGVAAAGAGCV
ncbi:hydrolase, partial [Halobaculum lipolyticum]